MRMTILKNLAAIGGLLLAGSVFADPITMSAGCPSSDPDCDAQGDGDTYSFSLTIEGVDDGDGDESFFEFLVTLTNSSDPLETDAIIDNFWINITESFSEWGNFNPDTWDLYVCPDAPNGCPPSIAFDYVGSPDSPSDRLDPGEVLSFSVAFENELGYTVFTDAQRANGVGGGTDSGQVCVSFQRLDIPAGSDQVCGDWDGGGDMDVSEPGTLALLGLGLLGIGYARRRKTAA